MFRVLTADNIPRIVDKVMPNEDDWERFAFNNWLFFRMESVWPIWDRVQTNIVVINDKIILQEWIALRQKENDDG